MENEKLTEKSGLSLLIHTFGGVALPVVPLVLTLPEFSFSAGLAADATAGLAADATAAAGEVAVASAARSARKKNSGSVSITGTTARATHDR